MYIAYTKNPVYQLKMACPKLLIFILITYGTKLTFGGFPIHNSLKWAILFREEVWFDYFGFFFYFFSYKFTPFFRNFTP